MPESTEPTNATTTLVAMGGSSCTVVAVTICEAVAVDGLWSTCVYCGSSQVSNRRQNAQNINDESSD
eukprot:6125951-Amphidinium_carterae.1